MSVAETAVEILSSVLTPQAGRLMAPPDMAVEPVPADTRAWLACVRAEVATRGDDVSTATVAGTAVAVAETAAPTAEGLARLAAERFAAGARDEAALALLGLSRIATADGLAGLAGLAYLDGRPDHARILATAAAEADPSHPRPQLVLGLLARDGGGAKVAQQHLAITSRLARRHPAFRDDQRAAQQILLLLHLG